MQIYKDRNVIQLKCFAAEMDFTKHMRCCLWRVHCWCYLFRIEKNDDPAPTNNAKCLYISLALMEWNTEEWFITRSKLLNYAETFHFERSFMRGHYSFSIRNLLSTVKTMDGEAVYAALWKWKLLFLHSFAWGQGKLKKTFSWEES